MNLLLRWVESTIIGLNLCPFAKKPFEQNRIKLVDSYAASHFEAQEAFLHELETLHEEPQLSTTLIGFEEWEIEFEDFLEFSQAMEELLADADLQDSYQLVAFHPDFRLAGFPDDSFAHYPNQAPMPVLHILRADEVAQAASNTQGIKISEANEKTIAALSPEQLQKYFFWK